MFFYNFYIFNDFTYLFSGQRRVECQTEKDYTRISPSCNKNFAMTNCIVSFEPRLAYSELLSYKYLWAVWDSVESVGRRQHWVANIFGLYGAVLSQWKGTALSCKYLWSVWDSVESVGRGQQWVANIFDLYGMRGMRTALSCAISLSCTGSGQCWVRWNRTALSCKNILVS